MATFRKRLALAREERLPDFVFGVQYAAVGDDGLAKDIAMGRGLNRQKNAVQHDRCERQVDGLQHGDLTAWCRSGKARQDQGENRQGEQHREKGVGTLQVVRLLAVAETTQHKADPDQEIHGDHDHCHHRVAGNGRRVCTGQHDGADQSNLYDDYGKRKNERPEWFAKQGRQRLGPPASVRPGDLDRDWRLVVCRGQQHVRPGLGERVRVW